MGCHTLLQNFSSTFKWSICKSACKNSWSMTHHQNSMQLNQFYPILGRTSCCFLLAKSHLAKSPSHRDRTPLVLQNLPGCLPWACRLVESQQWTSEGHHHHHPTTWSIFPERFAMQTCLKWHRMLRMLQRNLHGTPWNPAAFCYVLWALENNGFRRKKKTSEVRHIVLCHVKTQSVRCPWELRNSWQTTAPIQWDCMPISPACHQASPAQSKHPKTRAQTFHT